MFSGVGTNRERKKNEKKMNRERKKNEKKTNRERTVNGNIFKISDHIYYI